MHNGDIIGLGLVNRDIVAVTPEWGADDKVNAEAIFEQVGGPVPVALSAMARLGLASPPVFLGVIGEDADGRAIEEELREADVAPELVRAGGGRTSRSVVVIRSADGARFVANHAADLPPLRLTAAHESWLRRAALLHTDGRDLPPCLRAAEIVRASGGVISLDLGAMRPGREALFPLCDILIASRKGGAGAFPDCADDPAEQTRRFLSSGVGVAGVTLGAEGMFLAARDLTPTHVPAFRVADVRDTCGAGDTFHGAFLWAFRRGDAPLAAARFASAAVALRIQTYGNQIGLPALSSVNRFLNSRTWV